jgi:RNA polymerase sigma factor (sigma-70 family)
MSSIPVDEAFERLYRHHVRDVYRFALALLRNPSEAEDVTQTTFLNAYRAMEAGEEPRRPQNWLLTIAHNTARSRVRIAMRRPREVPLDDVVNQLTVPEHERTNVRELLRALARLPFNQRAAITMRELEGRSYPEIAETLGVTVPAVEALLTRARRSLRLHAGAIRGLAVVGLPRSLRRLLENGETAAGGAIGAGAVAKVAAVVVAGVVAGGVGFTSSDAGTPQAQGPERPALVRHFEHAAARLLRRSGAARAAKAPNSVAAAVHAATRVARTAKPIATSGSDLSEPRSVTRPAPAAAATAAPPASSAAAARPHPVRSTVVAHPVRSAVATGAAAVTSATSAVVATVESAVASAPTVSPVQLPAPPLPSLPPLPDPPALPNLP